jgi:hypothetical protein
MLKEILLILLYTGVLSFLIFRLKFFTVPSVKAKYIVLAFVIKVIAGCVLGFLYTHHYTDRQKADTFKFFDDSGVMMEALAVNPRHFYELFTGIGMDDPELEPYFYKMNTWMTEDFYVSSNRMMVRMNTVFRFLTPGEHYYLHVVFINFLSLLGLVFFCKTFFLKIERNRLLLFAAIILFPSLLFWGSGLLKDGVILFAAGAMLYSFSRMLNGTPHRSLHIITFLLSSVLMALIKIYILMAMVPALTAWLWFSLNRKKIILKFIAAHIAVFAGVFVLKYISPQLDVVHYLDLKQREFFMAVEIEKPNHVLKIAPLNNSASVMLIQSAPAFFRTLLRPHIFEASGMLIVIAAAENLFILLLLVLALISIRKGAWSSDPLFYFSVSFFILIFILIGLIVPVTGAVVRYKIIAIPFMLYIFIRLFQSGKLEKYFLRIS